MSQAIRENISTRQEAPARSLKRPFVVSVVGKSGSGKTTFLEKLIPALKAEGFKVGVIKHDAHSFEIDHEGKDSHRLKKSGADMMAISSSTKIAVVKDVSHDAAISELVDEFFCGMDIVLTEGYRREKATKIEVSRQANTTELLCGPDECLAVVSDWDTRLGCPAFGMNDTAGVAALIVKLTRSLERN